MSEKCSVIRRLTLTSAASSEAILYAQRHWAGHLSSSPASALLNELSDLSSEYHDHEGHAGDVLAWLKVSRFVSFYCYIY